MSKTTQSQVSSVETLHRQQQQRLSEARITFQRLAHEQAQAPAPTRWTEIAKLNVWLESALSRFRAEQTHAKVHGCIDVSACTGFSFENDCCFFCGSIGARGEECLVSCVDRRMSEAMDERGHVFDEDADDPLTNPNCHRCKTALNDLEGVYCLIERDDDNETELGVEAVAVA